MRAIMVKQFGPADVMQVGEAGLPEPGRDEILVRVLAAGVGPWNVELRSGGWSDPLPYIPGAEFAGLVVGETGADAGFDDGAPVYGWPGPGGCYAQYVTCHVERLARSRPGRGLRRQAPQAARRADHRAEPGGPCPTGCVTASCTTTSTLSSPRRCGTVRTSSSPASRCECASETAPHRCELQARGLGRRRRSAGRTSRPEDVQAPPGPRR